jgi:hypothetical protein
MKANTYSVMKRNSFRPDPGTAFCLSLDPFTPAALDNTVAGSLPEKGRIASGRLSVRKINEVLRLKFSVGLGLRTIARSCSIGLGTGPTYCPSMLRLLPFQRMPLVHSLSRSTGRADR